MGWQEGTSDPDPIVKNKLMMFEDPAPPTPDPVPTVQTLMSGKNYALIAEDGSSWTKTDYFAAMNGSNAVMFAGHGNPDEHSVPGDSGVHWAEYEAYRISHIRSGIPPFNTGAIPVNFCHIIACNCGVTNNFVRACYPYYMAWGGPWMENQALLAYTCYTSQNHRAMNAELIWGKSGSRMDGAKGLALDKGRLDTDPSGGYRSTCTSDVRCKPARMAERQNQRFRVVWRPRRRQCEAQNSLHGDRRISPNSYISLVSPTMRRVEVERILATFGLAMVTGICMAQMSDEAAILEGRRYVSAWAPDSLQSRPSVMRGSLDVRGTSLPYIQVFFGDATTTLRADGTFMSFSVRGHALEPKGGAPDLYRTDEAAWRALDEIMNRVDLALPTELEPHKLEREDSVGLDYVLRLTMRLRPYGFETRSGHYLVAEIHRITGKLLYLSLPGTGWTYEPPNIRVSEAQAIEKAIETLGGEPYEWDVDLKYATSSFDRSPEYFKPLISQRIMRLLYRVTKFDGHSSTAIVVVDSVTGNVIASEILTVDKAGGADAATSFAKRRGTSQTISRDESSRNEPTSPTSNLTVALIVAGSLVVVGGLALAFRRSRNT